MKSFNKLYGLGLLSLFLCFAACTSETEEPTPTPAPEPSGQTERRSVLLTLQNKLSVAKTNNDTKAETIATANENKISSLDIYVFGSKTEDGTYTYQERFCYREKSSDLPTGSDVTAIDLNAIGDKGTETTALLSLKKGLFIKLYCIANQSKLIDPTNGNEFNNFVPLMQSNPGQAGNTVTDGIPVETDFKLFQSIQLDPLSATDLLLTPLPMTGAYTTPLDLTDFSVSARLQLGFRLTRSVARFDIVNDAKTSKFTIQSVSMANGRKGVSFFPLTVTGTKPATEGDLITYPARKFDGEKANEGTCTGAFYSWPSPLEDAGYLILSGTYAANATENIPVTYQVPFKPAGNGNYIEVAHNHRYTVAITAADEYHLDFTISVADWTDEGNIDEYQPGGDADANGVKVNVGEVDATYDPLTRTVTMPIVDNSQFTIEGNSTAGYNIRMYYENEDTEHQWLIMEPSADNTKAAAQSTVYTIKKNDEYKGTKYPVAFIRFTDKVSAKETVVIVQPFAKPSVLSKSLSSGSTYEDNVLTLYQTTTTPSPTATLNVFASGGSDLEFTGWASSANWLAVSPDMEQLLSSADYTLTLKSSDPSFPDPYPVEGKTITFSNKANKEMKETVTLKLKSDLTINSATEGQAEFDNSTSTLRLYNNEADKVKLTVNTIGGSEVVDVPDWLTVTKENDGKNETTYTFYVTSGAATGVNANIKIHSKADNTIAKTYNVYSISNAVTFSSPTATSYTTINSFTSTTPSISYFPYSGSYIDFTVTSPKGITGSNTGWCGISLSEKTLSTGQKETKVRLQTTMTDQWHGSAPGNSTVTVSDKYSNTTKKTITVSQRDIVYPGSKIPPKKLDSNGIHWWVAMENANNGKVIDYTSFWNNKDRLCPSGWKIPSSAEYKKIWNSNTLLCPHSNVSAEVKNTILSIYGSDYIVYFSTDPQSEKFRSGMIPVERPGHAYVDGLGASSGYVRCVKDQ